MIIKCINCNKKFEVDSNLIPDEGRDIQCGSCNKVWFFKKDQQENLVKPIKREEEKVFSSNKKNNGNIKNLQKSNTPLDYIENTNTSVSTKYETKSSFTFGRLLSYIIITIISFIALIIVLDTFKFPLYGIFPSLELVLFNLFETLKDVSLFIKDLT
tara:strand:- start:55 stop:525 length:471 start_codon:yes stop_codon:yes gene_type:complete